MAENTFPVFSADEIVHFYRTEVLTGQEAKHLKKSDLTPVPKVPLSENIQYPAYHEGATAILSVYARMRHFLPICLVYEFSLSDLLAPKKLKTLTILSAVMNFLRFRKERLECAMEKQAKFRADTDRLQFYTKANAEAEKKLEMLTTIPPEQQAEADELAAALSELQTTTMHEYQDVNTLNDSIAEWKTTIAEKTQKLAQMKVDVSSLKEEIGKLKSQIVESPEELKSQMEKMRESVKTIKESIEKTDESVVELQNMVQDVSHAEAEVQQIYGLLQDLESSMGNAKQRQEKHQELVAQCERKQKELKNLCGEEGQLKRALGMKQDKDCKMKIRRQKKREMKEQRVQEVMGECNQIHQKREEMAGRIQNICAETQQLKADIKSLKDACSEETKRAQVLFDTVCAEMDGLHRRIEMHLSDLRG
ncbi:kinetochore protein Nuf2-like isoform 2-T2 [Pholidichthys leucotaenia]